MKNILSIVEIPIDQVTSTRILRFDAYWRSKLRDGALPRRDDIDAVEIKSLLPFLVIVDIEADPFRVRYRLCGSMVSNYDEELTDKYLEDLRNTSPEDIEALRQLYRTAAIQRRPVFGQMSSSPSRRTGNLLQVVGAIWPLSSEGQRVDKCAAIEDFPSIG